MLFCLLLFSVSLATVALPDRPCYKVAHARDTGDVQSPEECPICHDPLTHPDGSVVLTHCHHEFHRDCLEGALSLRQPCPMCRAPLLNALISNERAAGDRLIVERLKGTHDLVVKFFRHRFPAEMRQCLQAVRRALPFPEPNQLWMRLASLVLYQLVLQAQLLLNSGDTLESFNPLFRALNDGARIGMAMRRDTPERFAADFTAAVAELPPLHPVTAATWRALVGSRLVNGILIPLQVRRHAAISAAMISLIDGISNNPTSRMLIREIGTTGLVAVVNLRFPDIFGRFREYIQSLTVEEQNCLNLFGWLYITLASQAQRIFRAGESLDLFDSYLTKINGGDLTDALKAEFRTAVSELPDCSNPTPATWTALSASSLVRGFLIPLRERQTAQAAAPVDGPFRNVRPRRS